MKIAVVYDWIDSWGGVERLLLILHEMFPRAPFFTSYVDYDRAPWAKDITVKTSFMQRLPDFINKNRIRSLPFYPFAFESFTFNEYDVVLSVSSSFAKGIITLPSTKHVNICLTPTRFLWLYPDLYKANNAFSQQCIDYLKKWDAVAAKRPDTVISISQTVQKRVKDNYNRESDVIYPPFDSQYWDKIKLEIRNIKFETKTKYKILNTKYFLIVSRLEPYKRIDIAVEAFKKIHDKKLIIIGVGTQYKKLKSNAPPNVLFMQDMNDKDLAYCYSHARALLLPQEEDFGYTALEAQFFGCPVIAYKKGGAQETIIKDKTGLYFENQTVEELYGAIKKYDTIGASLRDTARIEGPKNVERFGKKMFINELMKLIEVA